MVAKDWDIADYADRNDQILITKDLDFSNSHLIIGKPKKLIKIYLGNISNDELIEIFDSNLEKVEKVNAESNQFMIEVHKENLWIITT